MTHWLFGLKFEPKAERDRPPSQALPEDNSCGSVDNKYPQVGTKQQEVLIIVRNLCQYLCNLDMH